MSLRKYSFYSQVVNVWNSLPNYVLEDDSINVFLKKRLDTTTTAIGRKAFSFADPTVWNSIPLSIRQSHIFILRKER